MGAGERETTALWREVAALLARARTARPLHQSDALLDLDRLAGDGAGPPLARLVRALEGWDGRLILTATDDGLAPAIRRGDRLVIDAAAEARVGDCVVALARGALLVRRLRLRDGASWLESAVAPPLALGPLVAVLGAVVEVRRALRA